MWALDAGHHRFAEFVMRYTLSLYEKAMPDDMPLTQKLLSARECGYDGCELCVDTDTSRIARLDWTRSQRRELAEFLRREGLYITTFSLSALRSWTLGALDAGSNARALAMAEKAMDLCRDLGARILLINGYDVYSLPSTPQTAGRFRENLARVADIAASRGVMVGLENAEMPFIDSIAKAAAWVREINCPFLAVYGDVGNSYNAMEGSTPKVLADIEAGCGALSAVHLKDTEPGEYRYTRYGRGQVDFAASVSRCLDMGVRIFTAELFYQPHLPWKDEAVRVNRFLRGYFPNT